LTIEPKLATPEQDLGGMARALLRRWRPALAVVALTLLAAVAVSRLGGEHYEATAQILIQQPDEVNAVLNPDATASAANAQREVNTNAELITSIPVVDAVRHSLRLRESAQSLADRLSVSGEATSNLVRITARDPRPQQAARIATAVALEYQNYRRESAQEAIGFAITAARARLDGMTPTVRDSAEGQALSARLHQLEPAEAIATGGVQIVRPAAVPAAAVPRLGALQAAVALLLGLLLAAAVVAILERTDRRLVDDDALEAALGLPVLARVPRRRRQRGAEEPERVAAYDSLAARLRLTAPGRDARVLMVAPAAGRVARDVVEQLAAAISSLGERVLVIMADFRPDGTEPQTATSGLAAVLRRESTLGAELVRLSKGRDGGRPVEDAPSWELLPAGESVRRSASLLGSAAFEDVVLEAGERADVVIVVAPPLAAAGDALILATACDAILAVVGPHPMTADDAQRVNDMLAAASAPVLGVVFDRARRAATPRPRRPRGAAKARTPQVGPASEPAQPGTAGA
jgi:succinoglycan biosynthesis transport protein ExoP